DDLSTLRNPISGYNFDNFSTSPAFCSLMSLPTSVSVSMIVSATKLAANLLWTLSLRRRVGRNWLCLLWLCGWRYRYYLLLRCCSRGLRLLTNECLKLGLLG